MNRIVSILVIAMLFALSSPAILHAEEVAPAAGSSVLVLSGTVVLDWNCDGKRGRGEKPLRAKVSLHIVNLASGEVEQTVDAVRGRWSANVPIVGRYAVQAPAWIVQQGYVSAPNGDSLLVDGKSDELTGTPARSILVCKINR